MISRATQINSELTANYIGNIPPPLRYFIYLYLYMCLRVFRQFVSATPETILNVYFVARTQK